MVMKSDARVIEGKRNVAIFKDIAAGDRKMMTAQRHGLYEVCNLHYKHLRAGLKRGTRGGVMYSFRGKKLRASKAGEYPQRRSGTLRGSAGFRVVSSRLGIVETKAPYGKYLEGGTRFMGPRPFMKKSASEMSKKVKGILTKHVDKEFKKRYA